MGAALGTEPALTVLMPVKAFHPVYLDRAFDSLLAQTSPRWALLVVVEPEDFAAMSTRLRDRLADPRVSLIANEGRLLAGAVNTAMRRAATEYVALLLGDDMWAPEAVEILARYIERVPDADFFHTGRAVVDGRDRRISPPFPPREQFTLKDFEAGSPVKHLLCWRRGTALAFGGLDETLNSVGPDDYDFPWLMAEHGARFMPIDACLYLYRDHRECFRLTTHLPKSTHARELRRILRKHGVGRAAVERRVTAAKLTYLRQCLYRTPLDRWLKERRGHDPARGWRERYD